MAFNIDSHNPVYDSFVDSWHLLRDCVAGEETIKDRGLTYLPMKSGMMVIDDLELRAAAYAAYQLRAEFPELVAPTITGSRGLVHSMPATYEIPDKLSYILERATKDGRTLESFHEEVTTEILTTGRFGILPGVLTDGTFYMAGYSAEAIINWDTDDGITNYVVLDESRKVRDPSSNLWSEKKRHLELSLADGIYTAKRYEEGQPVTEATEARTPSRQALKEIPFVFINVGDLGADPDDVPLYGLAKISTRIYRMDADYTHSLHMTSEPTPWVAGYDNVAKAVQDGIVPRSIGASKIWILPKGGQAGFLEFTGPGIEAQAKAIGSSLERAVLFGAQILSEENRAAESGESRKLRLRSQQSILKTISKNTCAGIEKALRQIAVWSGINPDTINVRPSQDFIDYSLSAQELTALVSGWQSGAYSKKTLFENIQRAGMIPNERTFEEEEDLISEETPPLSAVPPAPKQTPGQPGNKQQQQADPNADPNNPNGNQQ